MTRIVADWLTMPASQRVCAVLESAGHQALFVGGCVRNALMQAPVADLDISTDARPDQVMQLAQKAGIKAVPTGIAHGTVTLVLDQDAFEITTFRRDIETDGRRAVVAFADTIEEDARRRDFTMNALYARADGTVIDPLGGLPDLQARRVRFIERAEDRIREDYLRTLRFFRFHAWYGDPDAGMDADALAAIAANLDGLETLSRERVGAETLKLLGAPDPAPAVAAMRATGTLARILPGTDDRALAPLVHMELQLQLPPDPLRRLAALCSAETMATLRLSRSQVSQAGAIRQAASAPGTAAELGYRLGAEVARDAIVVRAALIEQPLAPTDLAAAAHGAQQRLPIKPADLMPAYSGVALGTVLKKLEKDWITSGFTLSRDELLALSRRQEG
ncbi:MAG: CCA tRNA nucleotidyltransferase [Pseudomonadota bacterium]